MAGVTVSVTGNFRAQLLAFAKKVKTAEANLYEGVVNEAERSIVEGSEVTGAPGQPVLTGALRESWKRSDEGPRVTVLSSDLPYASVIENGVGQHGPITLRSAVGGFHSVKLTRAGWRRIVNYVLRKVKAGESLIAKSPTRLARRERARREWRDRQR